jgi:hypothetical protein
MEKKCADTQVLQGLLFSSVLRQFLVPDCAVVIHQELIICVSRELQKVNMCRLSIFNSLILLSIDSFQDLSSIES